VFQRLVTERVEADPNINLLREELRTVPDEGPVIVASGPLTSESLVGSLTSLLAMDTLYFYDATAPIIAAESIDRDIVFRANRRDGEAEGDYLNCPFTEDEYNRFVDAILAADRYPLHEFETGKFFESCMPIDELADRGRKTLAFGPMRPVGLIDPRTGRRP
ncbi:MAG: methylenetetrahydrofolate--tRNA-(uracil(54)-C(5))-methyltransferase (FADH(2)-oxidizing) TrmFO, partial [Gemmatimonadetes bacterium]|nr:methylenetetrahydrofolate--tRNA-(uracil(54)-C(5))-methyltransferase (FADH(2)-oxidizing) TrmFO [Gemmatimonadota bacterium]